MYMYVGTCKILHMAFLHLASPSEILIAYRFYSQEDLCQGNAATLLVWRENVFKNQTIQRGISVVYKEQDQDEKSLSTHSGFIPSLIPNSTI